MFDTALFAGCRTYIGATATPRETLAAASGITTDDLIAIEACGALPAPTYVVFEGAIRSPIRTLGEPPDGGGQQFFAPAVLPWLRRAAFVEPRRAGLLDRLQTWFATSFREALVLQADDARRYAWSALFNDNGSLNEDSLRAEVEKLNREWLNGGWAVCLRRWNGYHVVTKDLERARISAISEDGQRDLEKDDRQALFNAIEKLDSVILPFAPNERPHGTPGLFIDRMRERYGL